MILKKMGLQLKKPHLLDSQKNYFLKFPLITHSFSKINTIIIICNKSPDKRGLRSLCDFTVDNLNKQPL